MKYYVLTLFVALSLIYVNASKDCEKCLKKEVCTAFGKLSKKEQDDWQMKYPCSSAENHAYRKIYGFDPIAKGDFVCCSEAVQNITVGSRLSDYNNYYNNGNTGYSYPHVQNPVGYNRNTRPHNNDWGSNNAGYQSNPTYSYQPVNTQPPHKNYFNVNNNPYVTSSPFFPGHGRGNSGNNIHRGQCPITSFPPKPETGCCGREASDSDRIIDKPKPQSYYDNGPTIRRTRPGTHQNPKSYDNSGWSWAPHSRVARAAPVEVGIRIAGGRETELEQFPWTVLLEITFDYGDRRQGFNCGGSLLSSKYVLTAGHCVFDKGGKVIDINIYLAEYDKRTFPKDCKVVLGQGKKCIENIVMKAEDVVLHPQYDDEHLNNDIALIKIQGNAPYTDYIRPICLPSIDIDNPDFFNLRLAVVGWGRNGRYRSDIKQSTIVQLVTQDKCKKFYPSLSRRQMCAAGYTGEDTCKGDSGGPLMTVYGGKYEVVGVVSGKRADSPCGTSVPSLYTSVYHYSDWIRSNMKN